MFGLGLEGGHYCYAFHICIKILAFWDVAPCCVVDVYHHLEDGIILFFLNIGIHQPDCTVSHLRRLIAVLRVSHASYTSER